MCSLFPLGAIHFFRSSIKSHISAIGNPLVGIVIVTLINLVCCFMPVGSIVFLKSTTLIVLETELRTGLIQGIGINRIPIVSISGIGHILII